MRPNNNILLNAVSPAVNQNSIAQWAVDIVRASFQLIATGTAAGTIQIQASNDQAVGLPPNQFQPTNWNNIGSAVTVAGAGSYLVPEIEMSYEYLRLTYVSTASGAQTIAPIADTGVLQHQTVTTVADVAGSLNNKYFLLSSINTTSKAQKNFYLWLDDGAGVDPALAGKTGIHVTYSDGDTANTLATSIRTALNALTGDFVATGSNANVIITSVAPGPVTAAADGAAATGFTFGSATAGVASNLNSKYFLLNSGGASPNHYYVWFNVSSIGVDPAPAGLTAAPVSITAGSSAATVGTALASAIAALNTSADFTATGTTTVTVTDKVSGPVTPASDVSSGFTFALTTPSGTISARMKSMGL